MDQLRRAVEMYLNDLHDIARYMKDEEFTDPAYLIDCAVNAAFFSRFKLKMNKGYKLESDTYIVGFK